MIEATHTPAPFGWTDAFLLGYAPLDSVHHEFVEAVAALAAADATAMPGALSVVQDHCRSHFATEEGWMAETAFPAHECHADEHAAVLASIEGVVRRVGDGDTAAGHALARALVEWFPGHADYMDAALAHWMCQRRLGGKPVVLRRRVAASATEQGSC